MLPGTVVVTVVVGTVVVGTVVVGTVAAGTVVAGTVVVGTVVVGAVAAGTVVGGSTVTEPAAVRRFIGDPGAGTVLVTVIVGPVEGDDPGPPGARDVLDQVVPSGASTDETVTIPPVPPRAAPAGAVASRAELSEADPATTAAVSSAIPRAVRRAGGGLGTVGGPLGWHNCLPVRPGRPRS